MLTSSRSIFSALLGTCVGYTVAVIIYAFFIHFYAVGAAKPTQLLDWVLTAYEDNTAQKVLYLALLFCGWLGGLYFLRWQFGFHKFLFAFFSLFVVSISYTINLITQGQSMVLALLVTSMTLLLSFALTKKNERANTVNFISLPVTRLSLLGLLASSLLLVMLFWPASIEATAAGFKFNHHPVSFIIGPALYFKADHLLIPGIDYLPQYGVGLGWLFSHFLSNNVQQVLMHYAQFIAAGTIFYAITSLWIGRWLLGSTVWSLLAQIIILIAMFHGNTHYLDGSSWPIRHPLIMVCVGLFMWNANQPVKKLPQFLLGMGIGLSIFWNTETS